HPLPFGTPTARHRPLHDAPGLVPTNAQQAGRSQDIRFAQHINGPTLKSRGELRAGQGPRNLDLPGAVPQATHTGDTRMDPGKKRTAVQMPPATRGDMIAYRQCQSAFGAREARPTPMHDLDIDPFLLRGKVDTLNRPRRRQPQQLTIQFDYSHGSRPQWSHLYTNFRPQKTQKDQK